MKRIIFILIPVIIVLASCKSAAYFDTPNNVKNMPATLYLADGKTYQGRLVVHTSLYSNSAVKLYQDEDKKPMRFSLMDVKGYQFRNDYYALKEVRGGIRLGKEFSFMKRLTKEDSRIHLYENTEKVTTSNPYGGSYTTYETQYYLQMPGEQGDAVWPLSSNKFVPNFDEKMSKLVADCPSLAAKIANKEPGYFYAQVSMFKEKRANVLMQIIDEYNNCGK